MDISGPTIISTYEQCLIGLDDAVRQDLDKIIDAVGYALGNDTIIYDVDRFDVYHYSISNGVINMVLMMPDSHDGCCFTTRLQKTNIEFRCEGSLVRIIDPPIQVVCDFEKYQISICVDLRS